MEGPRLINNLFVGILQHPPIPGAIVIPDSSRAAGVSKLATALAGPPLTVAEGINRSLST